MFNVCWRCGAYRPDKIIDPAGPFALCPECGHAYRFKQWPLLVVGGASGAGKSTVCQALLGQLDQVVVLDTDILWGPAWSGDLPAYYEQWLRVGKNIGQAGRPVVLFGSGLGVPGNLEGCVERRYFAASHYLALVCDPAVQAKRLSGRPAWRGSHTAEHIAAQQRFNDWFRAYAGDPPMTRIDTTTAPLAGTVAQVSAWIATHMPA